MGKYDWDHGLDFVETRAKLGAAINKFRIQSVKDGSARRRLAGYEVLITQLVNASRISEAYEAVVSWVQNGKPEQQIRVRKKRYRCLCIHAKGSHTFIQDPALPRGHGRRGGCELKGCPCTGYRPDKTDIELRLMVIPPEFRNEDRFFLDYAFTSHFTLDAVIMFAIREAGFNSHSLRYARISHLADKAPLQVIAKITHHKSLNFIVDYTQQKMADAKLRQVVAGEET